MLFGKVDVASGWVIKSSVEEAMDVWVDELVSEVAVEDACGVDSITDGSIEVSGSGFVRGGAGWAAGAGGGTTAGWAGIVSGLEAAAGMF